MCVDFRDMNKASYHNSSTLVLDDTKFMPVMVDSTTMFLLLNRVYNVSIIK